MKNKIKLAVLGGLVAFPLMVAFQNCSKTVAMQMTDESSLKAGSPAIVDTNNIPNNEPVAIDQQGGSNSAASVEEPQTQMPEAKDPSSTPDPVVSLPSGGDNMGDPQTLPPGGDVKGPDADEKGPQDDPKVSYQVEPPEDPVQEANNQIADARRACDADYHESQNNTEGTLSDDGKSLSHIQGNKVISSTDFNGLTDVNQISDAQGFIIVCGLHVASITKSAGSLILIDSTIDDLSGHKGNLLVDGSRALVSNSKANIVKTSGPSEDKGNKGGK